MIVCSKLGYNFTVVSPQGYEPNNAIVKECLAISNAQGATVEISHDLAGAVNGATAVYTDVWTSMGQEKEAEKRKHDFASFQVNKELLSHAPSDVLVSHCLPAHRGEEITSDILDSRQSMAFDEAENRLHVQKAVIVTIIFPSTGAPHND